MAEQSNFSYHNIELYKSESLGTGLYGWVCKAKCDGLLCAAKIMQSTLFDFRDDSYLLKFKQECHLLSLARHPNVIQYLATYCDPDTRLPVLLMELCDENLTAFLERSPGPLSYHIQLNICHDIALALVYLHFNGLIHRDLTVNNVLMIASTRAKITDFGMSELATVNPRMTALTLCAGNLLYMSPEALDEAKSYTTKLDIFPFGVIVIQILTRQLPNPSDRFHSVKVAEFEEVRVTVPETKRRQAHLKLIPDTHSLKPLVLQCLKKEGQRPSALELSARLSMLKQSSEYAESMCHTQSSSDIQQLQQQMCDQRIATETKARMQTEKHLSRIAELQSELQKKDKTISDLKETHETEIQQLKQQYTVSGDQPQQQSVTRPPTIVTAARKDIWKMTWRKGKSPPQKIAGGAAVVHGNTAYFRPCNSHKVYSYQIIGEEEVWSELPDNFYQNFGLAVVDGLVTSVGGYKNGSSSNILFSLRREGKMEEWSEILPPMPTQRSDAVCVTTEKALVVAGGYKSGSWTHENTVDVMNISSKQWTTVSLPQNRSQLSATACGDTLYLSVGEMSLSLFSEETSAVFTSSISKLMTTTSCLANPIGLGQMQSQSVWTTIVSLPVASSTLVKFGCDILAIGRCDSSSTTNVYRYDTDNNAWNVVNQKSGGWKQCIALALPGDRLLVIGLGEKNVARPGDRLLVIGLGEKNVAHPAAGDPVGVITEYEAVEILE